MGYAFMTVIDAIFDMLFPDREPPRRERDPTGIRVAADLPNGGSRANSLLLRRA
jgi:hypothetical protein